MSRDARISDGPFRYEPSMTEIAKRSTGLPGSKIVIGVSRYGGSGKTTFAAGLGDCLSAPVVSIDAFGTAGVFRPSIDWSGFDRGRLIREVLAPVSEGVRSITYGLCDDWESWQTVATEIAVDRYLIVEGVGLFHPDLLPYLSWRIWLDVSLPRATAQGIARERSNGRDVAALWESLWVPNEVAFDSRFQPRARAHCRVRPVDRLGARTPYAP